MANNKGNLDESISSDSDLEIIKEIPAPKKQKSGETANSSSLHHRSSQNGNTVIRSDDLVEYKQLVNGLNHGHTSTNSESEDMVQDGRDRDRDQGRNGNTSYIVITPKPTLAQGQSSKLPKAEAEAGRFQNGFFPPTAPAITAALSLPTLSPSVPSSLSLDVDKIKKSVRAQPEFAQYSNSNGDGGHSNGRSVARKSCSRINPQRRPVSFMSTGAPPVKNYGNQSPQVSSSQELFRNPWRQTSSGATPKPPRKKARNRRVIETSSSSDGSSASDDDSETGSSSSSTASSSSGSSESTTSASSDSDSSTDSENKPGAVNLQGQGSLLDAGNNTPQVVSPSRSELNVSTATAIRVVSRQTETETVAVTDTGIETVTLIQTVTETETATEQSVITTATGAGTATTSTSTVSKKHKKKIRRESRHDVEVVDLFEDDDDEIQNYAGIGPIDMICNACAKPRLFKMKPAFIQHHRRHISRDHFQCPTPTCLRGFTSLTLCMDHEEKAHNKKKIPTPTSSSRHQSQVEEQEGQGQERSTILAPPVPCSISATTRIDMDSDTASAVSSVATIRINTTEYQYQTNDRDGEFEWSDEYAHLDEYVAPGPSTSSTNNHQINKKKTRIVPSTMLTPYRGHPVSHMTECTDIEEKHGLRNRTLGAMGPIQQQIQAIRNLTFDEEHDYFG